MLEVKKCVTPNVDQWDTVITGMRNAYKSWKKHDSFYCYGDVSMEDSMYSDKCEPCPFYRREVNLDSPSIFNEWCEYDMGEGFPTYVLGRNDRDLLAMLTELGSSDRKVLRQLPIILEVKAPLYWWKQADKYQIGTVTNSESTMHTITKNPFKVEDFSFEHYQEITPEEADKNIYDLFSDDPWCPGFWADETDITFKEFLEEQIVGLLNALRKAYLKTKDMKYWYTLNEVLPQSYLQTRTWSLNYEVALNIIHQRKNHPLKEWKILIDYLMENVPYLSSLYDISRLKEQKLKVQIEVLERANKKYLQQLLDAGITPEDFLADED